MNPNEFKHFDEQKRDTFESLKKEYDSIQVDVNTIKNAKISEVAKKLPLEELQKQINDVKERMHNYIDTL